MTNRSLEIFVATAKYENMSEAARALFITQSSVSQVISDIEKEYNILLFDRLSRSLHLTEVGKVFLNYAQRVLALEQEMDDFLHVSSTHQKVRIGATVTVGTCVISPLLLQLKQRIPGLDSEVLVANTHILEEQLLKSELDLCLVEGHISHPDLIVRKAIPDQLVMICATDHPLAGRTDVTLQEIADFPIILREKGSGTRAQIEQEFQKRSIPIRITWDCYNTAAIVNAAADGHGVSILSERLVQDAVSYNRIYACPVSDADFSRSFDLVYHKDKYITPTLQSFMDISLAYGQKG